jgi:hypothetical protein
MNAVEEALRAEDAVDSPKSDPLAEPKRLALAAFDRWSQVDRKHELSPANNEARHVLSLVDSLADSPPIIRGNQPVGQHLLIPQAVELLIKRAAPFKRIQYAVATVRSELEEWSKGGIPGTSERRGRAAGSSNPVPRKPVYKPMD